MIFLKLIRYLQHHIIEKWKFIYFEIDINEFDSKFPKDKRLKIINAERHHLDKIRKDLYPYFTHKQEFDIRYIDRVGKEGINCFLAEKNGKFIHYFMVFSEADKSPLINTSFKVKNISKKDVYLGNAFTIPSERGALVLPTVLDEIVKYLKENYKNKSRAILLVHQDTPGAEKFFSILGFKKISLI